MNLVGREEFDRQCAVLEETRRRIEELERRLDGP
jgi:BMFP domain-containing protein YqiC